MEGRASGSHRLLGLAVAAAVATIALKVGAWLLTGSVGLLSDAAESVVNLVAAVLALVVVRVAARPPDAEHAYGHGKAEYFSASVEGALILAAAIGIAVAAAGRLIDPQPLRSVGVGVAVAAVAAAINLAMARALVGAGRRERSITLEAGGRHLMTDVWTSLGVIAGVAAVAITGVERLDPVIALAVAANILATGISLVRRSTGGLMDAQLPGEDRERIQAVLERYRREGVAFHALRTREAGRRGFISVHVLVPGAWSVQRGHDLLERLEGDLRAAVPYANVFTHLEPVEDPTSFDDTDFIRRQAGGTADP
jgi:cation diffusion facilitator family transporter